MLWKETFFCCKYNNSDCWANDPLYTKMFARLLLQQLLELLGCFWSELADSWLGGWGVWPRAPAAAFALVLAFECTLSWLTLQKMAKNPKNTAKEGVAVYRHNESDCSMLQCQKFCKGEAKGVWGEVHQQRERLWDLPLEELLILISCFVNPCPRWEEIRLVSRTYACLSL